MMRKALIEDTKEIMEIIKETIAEMDQPFLFTRSEEKLIHWHCAPPKSGRSAHQVL